MRYFSYLVIVVLVTASGCNMNVKEDKKEVKKEEEKKISKIRNDIKINAKGIKVDQAYLVFADDGNLVPEGNKFKLKQKIKVVLILSGWKEIEGKVRLDGGEMAQTSEGDMVLEEKDLFKEYENGLTAKDAGYVTFGFVLDSINKLYDFFKVSFYIKDQNDPERMVEGSYKLYLE